MTPIQPIRCARDRLAALALALAAPWAVAEVDRSSVASVPLPELKFAYLECDRIATRSMMDTESAAHCSFVSEALMRRAFDGDFNRLLAWWRGEKDAFAAARDRARERVSDAR